MATAVRYELVGDDIVSEEIDGEVIVVNLANGNYYSLSHSAAAIWVCLQKAAPLHAIEQHLRQRYSGEPEVMAQGLRDLIEALETEELIVPSSANGGGAPAEPLPEPSGEKLAYQAPVFERFTAMGALLLLDPVHEVEGQKGWPHPKDDS